MKKVLFWSTSIFLLASAVHIVTAVVMPRLEREKTLESIVSSVSSNQLTLVNSEKRDTFILQGVPPDLAIAICPFDISAAPLSITAPLPGSYWSVSIFNLEGENIYTINDKQVGTDQFSALIMREAEQIIQAEDAPQRKGEGIVIRSQTDQGIVLLRTFVPDRAALPRVEDVLAQTHCAPANTDPAPGKAAAS